MKCPKCGKECNGLNAIASAIYVCPFCGEDFGANGDKRENINQIMHDLIEQYGIDLLQNVNRMNAMLMDYAPHAEKERKLIIMVMREGILTHLLKLQDENEETIKIGINKCVKQLVADIWITEAAARYAVSVLANSIGVHVKLENANSNDQANHEQADGSHDQAMKMLTKDMGLSSEEAINYALKECDSIGYKALAANQAIKELVLPETIKAIYPKAFSNCINLRSICMPKGIQNISACAFEGCCALENIVVSDNAKYKVLEGLLIDKVNKRVIRAENRPKQDVVKITNGITTICKKAFERSKVRQVIIPMSVNYIEENAFFLTMNLKKFEVDSKNANYRTIDGVLHNREGNILVRYPQAKGCVNYYIEDSVEEIGLQAFSCAKHLETITFTSAVKRIGNKAFEYCINIENLLLPGSIETIGDRAFQYCENMRSVMLSRSIMEIGDCAFYHCVSLETVSIPRNVCKIGNLAFANCRKLRRMTIQERVSFIGDGAFVGCEGIEIMIKNNRYVETYCRSHGINYSKI